MQKLHLASAILALAASSVAQGLCTGSAPAASIGTKVPFGASHYVGTTGATKDAYCLFVDMTLSAPITVNSVDTWTYDYTGSPNGPMDGLICDVNIYWCQTTFQGNEMMLPQYPATGATGQAHPHAGTGGTTGVPWTLAGQGTMVVASAFGVDSVVTMAAPMVLDPAVQGSSFGLAIEILKPDATFPPNAATLAANTALMVETCHPLVQCTATCSGGALSSSLPQSDPFVTLTEDGFQGDAFTSGPNISFNTNVRFNYVPDPNAGFWESYGDPNYDSPPGFYDGIGTGVSIMSTPGFSMFPTAGVSGQANYLVAPAAGAYAPPDASAVSLNAIPPTAQSTASSIDDASWSIDLSSGPYAVFNGGAGVQFADGTSATPATSTHITVGSNGWIMFSDNQAASACFAYYGGFGDFRDLDPRIAGYFGDLDPSAGGTVWLYVTASTIDVHWELVPEWAAPAAITSYMVRLHANGQIDVFYDQAVGINNSAADGIVGYTPGFGSPIADEIDITNPAGFPFQSGDGNLGLRISLDQRPSVNATTPINLVMDNVPSGAILSTFGISLDLQPGGIDLSSFGLPDSNQYIGLAAGAFQNTGLVLSPGSTVTYTLPPGAINVNYLGYVIAYQGYVVTTNSYISNGVPNNLLGLGVAGLVSNSVCIRIGQ